MQHCCRDSRHVRLDGEGNAWLEVPTRQTLHGFLPRGVKVEEVGQTSGDNAALPTAARGQRPVTASRSQSNTHFDLPTFQRCFGVFAGRQRSAARKQTTQLFYLVYSI